MKYLKNSKKFTIYNLQFTILIILLLGAFLRFSGLNWGLPYPFHPDERNMAVAITRFSQKNLDPEFYAYGQFPLYLAYFSTQFFSYWLPEKIKETLSLEQATLLLRFWSAFFSTATIYVAYLISQKLFTKKSPITYHLSPTLAATAVAFTPGLIQAAHFGTTESILTFCFLAIVYLSLNILERPNLKNYFLAALFLGIALGSKITAVVFAAPLALATLWQFKNQRKIKEKLLIVLKILFTLSLSLSLTLLTSPYLLLAYRNSRSTLLYEISVAKGESLPFYTRQFFQTTPILFQFQKIFPYALGWPVFILGTLGLIVLMLSLVKIIIKHKKLLTLDLSFCLLTFAFLLYFVPNAFLFAKWTRFITPIFPFFSIFAFCFLNNLNKSIFSSKSKKLFTVYCLLFTVVSVLPGLFFSQIYFKPDIRFTASEWIYQNIPSGSRVLFDTANVVDIPILPPNHQPPATNYFLKMVSFNFYDLDQSPQLYELLLNYLETSDYIFVPSRRVFMNHLRFPEKYPLVTRYYQLLFSGNLGFKEIKTFSPFSGIFPITNHQSPTTSHQLLFVDELSEETFTVFDHPVIRIYKKIIRYNKLDYENLFKI